MEIDHSQSASYQSKGIEKRDCLCEASTRAVFPLHWSVWTRCGFATEKILTFRKAVENRFSALAKRNHIDQLDAKSLVDAIQDGVVLPALLEAEDLPFDAVTFQHILRASQDFLTASWTTSHPEHLGRLVFSTCGFDTGNEVIEKQPTQVAHRGVSFAEPSFSQALIDAYSKLSAANASYVNAYHLRAVVCVNLRIQPQVFERCLAARIAAKDVAGMKIFTELPFSPPPPGEDYVKAGFDRIGLIKLSS